MARRGLIILTLHFFSSHSDHTGYSCSDLLCVVKHAAMIPLREAMNLPLTSSMGNEIQEKGDDGFVPLIRGITLADLIQAVEIVATPAQDQGMMGL